MLKFSDNKNVLRIIDNSIIFFFIVFILSLTDSIFVNQIGYYGALLLIIARGFISKNNPFHKTGMEFAFLWFILAEILSFVFTQDPGTAIIFLLRRILLIPIVYATISSSTDIKKAKLFLKIYLGFSLVSVLIYLYFSVPYYMHGLFSIKESGPSIFQYPITVSEITSFTVVILFAFLINEKVSLKNRILLALAFTLSSLALFSTYKRTGWMGAAFGILIVLVIKKKWGMLSLGILLITALFVMEKNESELISYTYNDHHLYHEEIIKTAGRASDVLNPDSTTCFVSDYQNGLLIRHNDSLYQKIDLPASVVSTKRWNDSTYVASLIDTRFILLDYKEKYNLTVKGEFLTPGNTTGYSIVNGCLYIIDTDSGLTVIRNPGEINHPIRYPSLIGYEEIYADSANLILYSSKIGTGILVLQDNLPVGNITVFDKIIGINTAQIISGRFVTSGKEGLNVYNISRSGMQLIYSAPKIKNGFRIVNNNGRTFILTSERELYETVLGPDSAVIVSYNKLNFLPYNLSVYQDKIYFTYYKVSRLLSIFNNYNSSNFNRVALWEAGIKMFKDHPVFGVGDIDLANLYRHYKHPWNKEIQGHLHNNFIHILATLGIFGLAAVCFLFFRYLQISFRIYKERINVPFVSSLALGVVGSFCAFLVSGLTELNFWDHEIATLIWFLFGLNFALYKLTKKDQY